MTPITVIEKIRTRLLRDNPFFGSLAFKLEYIEDDSVGTLCTDAVKLWYSPKYLKGLLDTEQEFGLAHEILHCALLHPFRGKDLDPVLRNEAADYVVNAILINAGFTPMKGILHDARFKGMAFEQVYAILKKEAEEKKPPEQPESKPQPQGKDDDESESGGSATGEEEGDEKGEGDGDNGSGGAEDGTQAPGQVLPDSPTGSFVDAPAQVNESAAEGNTEQDWEIAAEQAMKVAHGQGTLPAGMEQAITKTREPKVDWVTETKDFITNTMPADYSWARPNRRFIGGGVYLPGTVKKNIGKIAVFVDASGSCWSSVPEFAAEVGGILREARPEEITVLYWDTRIQGIETFGPDNFDITITAKGGGGSIIAPAFQWLEEQDEKPVAVIVLTDLAIGGIPKDAPETPVLWVKPAWASGEGPWGKTLTIQ